jgi:hypothetical protein
LAVATSFNRQRVPMLDASTLEDRTRPVVEPAAWMSKRLRILHWSGWSQRVDRSPASRARRDPLYPGVPRFRRYQ